MKRPNPLVVVSLSMRRSERDMLDQAAKQSSMTRSEFVRVAALPVARAIVAPASAVAGRVDP
jgi:uncharacterized protein (DUF1778 family)